MPARAVLRLRDARAVRRASIAPRSISRPGDVAADHAAGRVARPQLLPAGVALGRLPRPRRRQLRLVDPRSGSRRELPRHGRRRRSSRPITTSSRATPSTLADAGRRPARSSSSPASSRRPTSSGSTSPATTFPKTLGHFNFWPLVPDVLATAQRRALGRAARARPDDGRHGRAVRQPDGRRRPPAEPPVRPTRSWGATRASCARSDTTRTTPTPATPGTSRATCFAADALAGRRRHHRNIDWDVAGGDDGRLARRLAALPRALVLAAHPGVPARRHRQQRLAHAVGRADRLPAQPRLRRPRPGRPSIVDRFDADVRAGHLIGTNGPVLDVTIDDGDGRRSTARACTPFAPARTPTLTISVAAAPWIPVTEVRVFVNGALAQTVDVSARFTSGNPFGTRRAARRVSAAARRRCSLPPTGDAWIVVEAGLAPGHARPTPTATACPISPDADLPARPAERRRSAASICEAIAPGVWPTAFSNPFFLDLDGGGWTGAGPAVRATRRPRRCSAGVLLVRRRRGARRAAQAASVRADSRRQRGPLAGGTEAEQPADFGAIPEACPGTDLSLRLRGELLRRERGARLLRPHHRRARRRARGGGSTPAERGSRSPLDLLTYRYVNNGRLGRDGRLVRARHGRLSPRAGDRRARGRRRLRARLCCRSTPPAERRRDRARARAPAAALGSSRRWLADGGVVARRPARRHRGAGPRPLQPGALAEVWFAPQPRSRCFGGPASGAEVAPASDASSASSRASGCARAARMACGWRFWPRSRWRGTTAPTSSPASSWAGPPEPVAGQGR